MMPTKRHFTRSDVEARCLEIHPPTNEHETVHILSVSLLEGTSLLLWEVRFERTYKKGSEFEHKYKAIDLYTEDRVEKKPVLLPCISIPLPAGYATVEEEDRVIAERRVTA